MLGYRPSQIDENVTRMRNVLNSDRRMCVRLLVIHFMAFKTPYQGRIFGAEGASASPREITENCL